MICVMNCKSDFICDLIVFVSPAITEESPGWRFCFRFLFVFVLFVSCMIFVINVVVLAMLLFISPCCSCCVFMNCSSDLIYMHYS